MKKLFRFSGTSMAGLALMLCLGGVGHAVAQGDMARTATVLTLHGKARVSSDRMTWHKLESGNVLRAGALIQTADNSTVDIVLGKPLSQPSGTLPDKDDAGVVRLFPNSVLAIDKLSSEHAGDALVEDIELDLRVGELSGVAGKPADGSKYEIKFAKGIVGVRGAAFRMTAGGLVTTSLGEVLAVLANADGSVTVKEVEAGHQFDPSTGSVNEISATPPTYSAPPIHENNSPAAPAGNNPPANNSPTAPVVKPEGRPIRPF